LRQRFGQHRRRGGKSKVLLHSILKKAFEGKLLSEEELEACRQEPDWEPAEQLLERIKNQKAVTI